MPRLTLLKAKEALKDKASADKLERRINRLHERVLLHGKFQGAIVRLLLNVRFGQLTPPRFIRAIEGIRMSDGRVTQMANRWFDFMQTRGPSCSCSMNLVRDLGDDHPTLYDLPAGGNLASNGTGTLTIYGLDDVNQPVTSVVLTDIDTAVNPFTTITRVHKEQKTGPIDLNHVNNILEVTPLVMMDAAEEETCYHRYRVDGLSTTESSVVEAICKRRHIEFTSDQDVLLISNLSALELGMDALQYEAENDHPTADKYLGKCVDLLNRELADTNSDNDIPTIQFRHIGATPNFYHGY